MSFVISFGAPTLVVEADGESKDTEGLDVVVPIRVDGERAGDKRKRDQSGEEKEVAVSRVASLRMGMSSLSASAHSTPPT